MALISTEDADEHRKEEAETCRFLRHPLLSFLRHLWIRTLAPYWSGMPTVSTAAPRLIAAADLEDLPQFDIAEIMLE